MKDLARPKTSTLALGRTQGTKALCSEILGASEGKVTRSDKYVHRSVLDQPRYDEMTVAILDEVWKSAAPGNLNWNVLRVAKAGSHLSMLSYFQFDSIGHPELELSLRVDLQTEGFTVTDYRGRANKPVLHRKETLVGEEYAYRRQFQCLTDREEELGLLLEAHKIGLARQWRSRLAAHGLDIRGHQIVRSREKSANQDV